MNYKPVFHTIGCLLLILSAAMSLPMLVDLHDNFQGWHVFASSQILTTFIGCLFVLTNRQYKDKTRILLKEMFLIATLSWIITTVFAALPFYFSDLNLTASQSLFEALSGLTTTGATVLTNLDTLPRGILLWRAQLNWIGGMGFLVLAVSFLPRMQIAGMQIFRTQSFDLERAVPSSNMMALYVCLIYTGLTVLCIALLSLSGMSHFDSLCHALSTISTGGFSTHDLSIGYFHSFRIESVLMFFMIMASLPYATFLRTLRGDKSALGDDPQIKFYIPLILVFTLLLWFYLFISGNYPLLPALRHALFQSVSMLTTSGFTSQQTASWGSFTIGLTLLAVFIGTCSGSVGGGLKIFRLQILSSMIKKQLHALIQPFGVFQTGYNGKPVDSVVQSSLGAFMFVYALVCLISISLLQLAGMDFTTAVTASVTALSNATPLNKFNDVDSMALWVLGVDMLAGRIEFMTLLVVLTPTFWKD